VATLRRRHRLTMNYRSRMDGVTRRRNIEKLENAVTSSELLGEFIFVEAGAEERNANLIETRGRGTQDRAVTVAGHQGSNEGAPRQSTQRLQDTRGLKPERRIEFILFPEERGEREELSNSPQIAAAIIHGGLPPLGERQFEERA